MPSRSGSTPIIWNDTIFLNVAVHPSRGGARTVERRSRSGAVAWKRTVGGGNHIERKQNMSSPSPVTDGAAVWVMTGTGILKAFDFKGTELWMRDIQKDYGRFGLQWGYASSPLLYEDALFVQVLHGMRTDDPSYLLRLDKKTGTTVWRVERPTPARQESPDAYTTPALLKNGAATGDRDHRWRRGDRSRPGHRQGTVARERTESREPGRLSGSSRRRWSRAAC